MISADGARGFDFAVYDDDPTPIASYDLSRLSLAGACVSYASAFYASAEADVLYRALRDEIPWQQHRLKLFGREIAAPRLSCWIGDPDAVYTYSRTRFLPQSWTPAIARLRDDLATHLGACFNSVLANLYRDGRDSMGWHSDDEPELGERPLIASLSFGAVRAFRLRSRRTRETALSLDLAHGSLLVMGGDTQRLYQHALPKRAGVDAPRINLTFRCVQCSANKQIQHLDFGRQPAHDASVSLRGKSFRRSRKST